jgi:hypothetical protein
MKKLIKQQFSNEIEKNFLIGLRQDLIGNIGISLKIIFFGTFGKILWEQLGWKLRDDLKRQLNENTN